MSTTMNENVELKCTYKESKCVCSKSGFLMNKFLMDKMKFNHSLIGNFCAGIEIDETLLNETQFSNCKRVGDLIIQMIGLSIKKNEQIVNLCCYANSFLMIKNEFYDGSFSIPTGVGFSTPLKTLLGGHLNVIIHCNEIGKTNEYNFLALLIKWYLHHA